MPSIKYSTHAFYWAKTSPMACALGKNAPAARKADGGLPRLQSQLLQVLSMMATICGRFRLELDPQMGGEAGVIERQISSFTLAVDGGLFIQFHDRTEVDASLLLCLYHSCTVDDRGPRTTWNKLARGFCLSLGLGQGEAMRQVLSWACMQVPAQQAASAAATPCEAGKQTQQLPGSPARPVFSMTASSRRRDLRQ